LYCGAVYVNCIGTASWDKVKSPSVASGRRCKDLSLSSTKPRNMITKRATVGETASVPTFGVTNGDSFPLQIVQGARQAIGENRATSAAIIQQITTPYLKSLQYMGRPSSPARVFDDKHGWDEQPQLQRHCPNAKFQWHASHIHRTWVDGSDKISEQVAIRDRVWSEERNWNTKTKTITKAKLQQTAADTHNCRLQAAPRRKRRMLLRANQGQGAVRRPACPTHNHKAVTATTPTSTYIPALFLPSCSSPAELSANCRQMLRLLMIHARCGPKQAEITNNFLSTTSAADGGRSSHTGLLPSSVLHATIAHKPHILSQNHHRNKGARGNSQRTHDKDGESALWQLCSRNSHCG
jgi:hypothetical protein